ncbi:MAG TPA: c-type cytochrome domain-containing protein [Verrucomicrobiae bacterium]|nr:c-type cytochrome domain-containing protein [Verrucomicrobiae bacterium]
MAAPTQRFNVALIALFICLQANGLAAEGTVDFSRVARLFNEHCLDCHASQDPEGKFVLESYASLMKGGESGPVLVAGQGEESLLIKMVEGKLEKEGKVRVMPPGKRKKLQTEEIAAIKAWINDGAKPPTIEESQPLVIAKISPKVPPRRAINSMAFDQKSRWLAVGRAGEVELYSGDEQALVHRFSGPAGNVNAVAFSPDGKLIYAAGGESGLAGELRIWTLTDRALARSLAAHRDAVYSLAVSPDGKMLATGSYDQKVKLWNAETGAEIRVLSGHNGCVYGLAFRPDGKILASASGDRTVKLWDTASGERRDTLSQPLKEQYTVAFSPDGKRLVAGGVDNRIRVWEVSEEARETTNPLITATFAHEGGILKLLFSPDGKTLASSADDKTVKLWNAAKLTERLLLPPQPEWAPALAFLDNKGLAVGRLDGSLAFYNQQNGSVLDVPKPELIAVEPRGVQRGVETQVRLTGKNLARVDQANFGNSAIAAEVIEEPDSGGSSLRLRIHPSPTIPRGKYEFSVSGLNGASGMISIYIGDLPHTQETESGNPQSIAATPVTIWGTHKESGDTDFFQFPGTAGETIVFDAAAKSLGSKANLVLTLSDDMGKVLASNNGFGNSGDPLLAFEFAHSGTYQLEVSELVLGGSPEHFYRIDVGAFPFVTAAYPPVISASESESELIGYNLTSPHRMKVQASNNVAEVTLPLDPESFRWRTRPKLKVGAWPATLEAEPNDNWRQANSLSTPGIVSGRFSPGDQEDWYAFAGKGGQTLVIETEAERTGSPADTKVEIMDAEGKPVLRTVLQAVRDSAITFRGIDSNSADCRVENWEEMELNQYLYLQGEVVRLFRAPQGPDSGFVFYTRNGKRRTYFDTTATAHANAEPCYIVQAHTPGTKIVATGLPVFDVFYQNDDEGERKLGSDSKVHFDVPKDGRYFVRVTETRSFSGERFIYSVTLREAQPDFRLAVEGMNPNVPRGGGQKFTVNVERLDGFEGEIKVEITGLPPGFSSSSPLTIQAGHSSAFGTINAAADAPKLSEQTASASMLIATAQINGKPVVHQMSALGKVVLKEEAQLYVSLEGESSGAREITLAPGGTVPARLKIRRAGHNELVTFQVENLPHGIIVDNIGLNGVLIPKEQNEREIFLTAAKWVPETDRLCYAVSNEAGRQTSLPVLLKVRKSAGQVARN